MAALARGPIGSGSAAAAAAAPTETVALAEPLPPAFDEAMQAVQRSLESQGLCSDWTSTLSLALRGPASASPTILQILERHGWIASSPSGAGYTGSSGGVGQFSGPPDRERLLRHIQSAAQQVAAAVSSYPAPAPVSACAQERRGLEAVSDEESHRSERKRFDEGYKLEEKVGEGTYGAVFKARCNRTKCVVAAKMVKSSPSHDDGVPPTAMREVAVLKAINHPNVVKLIDVCCWPQKLYLIFEFVQHNLKQHMKTFGMRLQPTAVRSLQQQLLMGLDFCHSRRTIHRDLKPQNLLVDSATADGGGRLKIADFGMARAFVVPLPRYTHEVVTTWYRAPEILFGCKEYSLPVDFWSAGCILAEMVSGSALFHGDSEIDTIFQIFRKLGTPSEAEWPGLSALPDFKQTFPQWRRRSWDDIRGIAAFLGPSGTEILDGLVRYDPSRRISTRRALQSPYFLEGVAATDVATRTSTDMET